MKKNIMFISYLLFILLFNSCKDNVKNVSETDTFKLPKSLKEVSGMTYLDDAIWVIQDNGNSEKIHKLSLEGELLKSIEINSVKNHDWEAITSDEDGNLYIGDFGNNDNNRKNLAIYKISNENLEKDKVNIEYTVNFNYEDQDEFPPKKHFLLYDCESFILHDDNFYLFTKNRSKGFDGTSHIYKLENKAGNQTAKLLKKYVTCDSFNSCAITDAAISPDGNKMALISNKRMWIFTNYSNSDFTNGKVKEIKFNSYTQREGVTFKDDNTLYITDEKTKNVGGNLYKYKLD
ncbi:SdiA-regulated domain-containing protein [Flavobacterium ponti]|jgi:hypothetical protein|uniref:SdiA-regulated domain-containing protein n=1 Tax=Flavobacterium ponti TaxID=665133 RepID=A0ABV9P871_9FLAO